MLKILYATINEIEMKGEINKHEELRKLKTQKALLG